MAGHWALLAGLELVHPGDCWPEKRKGGGGEPGTLVAVRAEVSRCCPSVVTFLLASLCFARVYPALVVYMVKRGVKKPHIHHLNCVLTDDCNSVFTTYWM